MYVEIAILALFTFLYSTISGRVDKLRTSGTIIFVIVGLILGPLGLGWFKDDLSRGQFRILVDLTLALILFIDAANSDTATLKKHFAIPGRMLLLGLPGSIILGFGVAYFLFDITLLEAAILSTMLAATDAALGKAVVTNKNVPARLREGLNSESGLNDGICVPILLIFIALSHSSSGKSGAEITPFLLVLEEIGIGAVVGLTLAGGGVWLLRKFDSMGWISNIWIQLSVPALAIACFAVAQSIHGSGYIAAFIGGLLFGILTKKDTHKLVMPGEGISEAMAMLTWMIFGALVIGQIAIYFTWEIVLYAILSLTVVRMIPVFLALSGLKESTTNKLFVGWFGPRGLASIVFAIIVIDEKIPGAEYLALVVACTVFMSLLVHGISANPLAQIIARKEGTLDAQNDEQDNEK